MELSGEVTSRIYEWFKGVDERKPRERKRLPVRLVEQAIGVIVRYPHWGGKKGAAYMLYHGIAVIAEKVYQWVKVAVVWAIENAIRARKLLPAPQGYSHEVPAAPGEIWSADFTHVRVEGAVLFLSAVRDNLSLKFLGCEASLGAGVELVLSPLRQALAESNGEPPTEFHITDRGTQYTCGVYDRALEQAGITHRLIPPGKPWANGTAENGMGELKRLFYRRWYAQRDREEVAADRPELLRRARRCLAHLIGELNTEIPCPSLKGVTPEDVHSGTADARRQAIGDFKERERLRIKEKGGLDDELTIHRKEVPKLVRQYLDAGNMPDDEVLVVSLLLKGKPLRFVNRVCPRGVG
jgi:transposase InsO family protein